MCTQVLTGVVPLAWSLYLYSGGPGKAEAEHCNRHEVGSVMITGWNMCKHPRMFREGT